jgi:hypothetical protein
MSSQLFKKLKVSSEKSGGEGFVGIGLESKPVSYSWFPAQEGPLHHLPAQELITGPAKIKLMTFIYSKGSVGGTISVVVDGGIRYCQLARG